YTVAMPPAPSSRSMAYCSARAAPRRSSTSDMASEATAREKERPDQDQLRQVGPRLRARRSRGLERGKTRPRRRAEYSDDAVVWPARARHDRLPVLEPAAQSRDSVLVSYRSSDRLPMLGRAWRCD